MTFEHRILCFWKIGLFFSSFNGNWVSWFVATARIIYRCSYELFFATRSPDTKAIMDLGHVWEELVFSASIGTTRKEILYHFIKGWSEQNPLHLRLCKSDQLYSLNPQYSRTRDCTPGSHLQTRKPLLLSPNQRSPSVQEQEPAHQDSHAKPRDSLHNSDLLDGESSSSCDIHLANKNMSRYKREEIFLVKPSQNLSNSKVGKYREHPQPSITASLTGYH